MPRSQQQIATLATGIKRATSPYLAGLFEIAAFPQAGRLTKISCGFPIVGPSKMASWARIQPKSLIRGNRLLARMMFNRTDG
jgi:hypothetical protein